MAWREEEHPRDGDGKFTDGNGSNPGKVKVALDRAGMNGLSRGHSGSILPGKGEPVKNERDTIKLPDERLPRSVGAKWANHEINLPNGEKARFVEGSKLQNKEIFAGKGCKRKIDDIERLLHDYPGSSESEWTKVKAVAEIQLPNRERIKANVHWYEEPSIGKVEFKFKSEEE